jgi:hypothetical protein
MGGRNPEPRKAGSLWKLKKIRKKAYAFADRRNQPGDTWALAW